MNKNVKRTIAMALTIGAFSVVGQTNYNIFTTEAHASTLDANELTDLELATSSGCNLNLYEDNDYDHELSGDLEVNRTYYTNTSSSNVVIKGIHGADEDNIRIFKENSNTVYKVDDDISISSETTTTFKVRVYKDEYDENKVYSSSDYNQYTIKVENTEDDDNTKTYNLKIVRTDATQEKGNFNGNNGLHNGWRDKNSTGNNGFHKGWKNENGAWHYLDNDGNMKKGWLKDTDKNWYYLDDYGKMKTGWYRDTDQNWYYLDNNGKMKINWIKDADGNWYYLQSSGKMAKNTTIDGYKLDVNGAWVK